MTRPIPIELGKPPLVDAVFEIRLEASVPLTTILPGLYFTRLGKDNVRIETSPIAQMPAAIKESDPMLRYQPSIRIHWGDRFLILIGDHTLSLACTLPYPGWKAFKPAIQEVFKIALENTGIDRIVRHSTKYTNIVAIPTLAEQVAGFEWGLRIGRHVVKDEVLSVRVEFEEEGYVNAVALATGTQAVVQIDHKSTERAGAVLEVDTLSTAGPMSPDDFLVQFDEIAERIHALNKATFFECLTDPTLASLEPIYE